MVQTKTEKRKNNDAEPIAKDTSFQDVLEKHPETAEVFFRRGMHCLGCAAASFETIADGAEAHGIDVELLVKDLNKVIKRK